jgi:hypothetical protein
LDYAGLSPRNGPGPPLAGWILFALGAALCVINLGGIVAEGGEFFFSPGLGLFSLVFFAVGAISAAVDWRRQSPRAGLVVVLSLVGMGASVVLACTGLPKR